MAERAPRKPKIKLENTRFIYKTNFAGKENDFGNDSRQANVVINDQAVLDYLLAQGYNVKETKPRDEEDDQFIPEYFVVVKVNYDSEYPPEIYLVEGTCEPVLLDANTVGQIDLSYIKNVDVELGQYENQKTGKKSLWVNLMYVEKHESSDPFKHKYGNSRISAFDED